MRKCIILLCFAALEMVACGSADDAGASNRAGASRRDTSDGANPSGGGLVPVENGSDSIVPGMQTGTSSTPGGVINDPNVCASAQVTATHATPDVYFVIDGSSSMNAPFGDGTRWSVLRDALVGDNGVIRRLDSAVKFGMAIYSNNDPTACPAMTEVPSALNNLSAIDSAYPMMETGGGTPTGEALQQVIDTLPDFSNLLDSQDTPPIIILATDGEPNGCSNAATCDWVDWANCLGQLLNQLASAPATYDSTLAAVRAAKAKGIPVWVISLADGLNSIPQLQQTANIGAGLAEDASPGATIYSPQNPDDLTQTLTKLLGDAVSCEIQLAGQLKVDRACEGTVMMNGDALDCNSDQGWKALDETHIALQGMACDRFKSDPTVMLDARFPCDVVILQ